MPTGVYQRTEEYIKSISGKNSPNFGKAGYWKNKPRSDATKIKMREKAKGNKNALGYRQSKEHKTKISIALKGQVGYWRDKHLSQKHKMRIGAKLKRENNPNWKDGISPKNHLIRNSFEMSEFRTMVFGRDGFACQMCFRKGVYLNAHHIKSFSKYPELRFVIDNGITLCKECHDKTKGKEEEYAPLLQTLVLNQKNRG